MNFARAARPWCMTSFTRPRTTWMNLPSAISMATSSASARPAQRHRGGMPDALLHRWPRIGVEDLARGLLIFRIDDDGDAAPLPESWLGAAGVVRHHHRLNPCRVEGAFRHLGFRPAAE